MSSEAPEIRDFPGLVAKILAAFMGAAIGDAMGWPNERRDHVRRAEQQSHADMTAFRAWTKRLGGRFMPHSETIAAGEYSDDTQLILALTRSLIAAKEWWRDFAFVEMPLWTLYERGGGSAVKHAAQRLASGMPPWASNDDERRTYFQAGANGAAMRVLPVVAYALAKEPDASLSALCAAASVPTHGHPRALLGASLFAYALRTAFTHAGTLGYGSLLEAMLDARSQWAEFPSLKHYWSDWDQAALGEPNLAYHELWQTVVGETDDLLRKAQKGLSKGALAIDQETLAELGNFDPRINGAGTIAAVSALFLASRYSTAPMQGVVRAAFATGADTDTLASMTGALLGAAVGGEWTLSAARNLQDARYIADTATRLASTDPRARPESRPRVTSKDLQRFVDLLDGAPREARLELPDGRRIATVEKGPAESRSPTLEVHSFRLVLEDRQTIYVKRLRRTRNEVSHSKPSPSRAKRIRSLRVCLEVSALERSREFYEDVLGLYADRKFPDSIIFRELISLQQISTIGGKPESNGQSQPVLVLHVDDLEHWRERVLTGGASDVRSIAASSHGPYRMFTCRDPDGHHLEFVEQTGAARRI